MSNPSETDFPDIPETPALHEDDGDVEDNIGELVDDPFLMEEDD